VTECNRCGACCDTRTCTAHDDRPPICSGYPWYGLLAGSRWLDPPCSFHADTRVNLPIVAVRHG
jgi:hypothetical protein